MEVYDAERWNVNSDKGATIVDLSEAVENIVNREDFVSFVRTLLSTLKAKPDKWTNSDLESFLDALAAWVEDMDGYYLNMGKAVPEQPTWKTFGQILLAAKVYE